MGAGWGFGHVVMNSFGSTERQLTHNFPAKQTPRGAYSGWRGLRCAEASWGRRAPLPARSRADCC